MTKTLITQYGEVVLRGAIFDVNGTDLIEGVEIIIDDALAGEAIGVSFGEVEDLSVSEVEKFMEQHCEYL